MKSSPLGILLLLLLIPVLPALSTEKMSGVEEPLHFKMDLPPEVDSSYRPDGYGAGVLFAFLIMGGTIGGAAAVSSVVCPIVFTSLYVETYGEQEVMFKGMISSISVFATLIGGGLTVLESATFFSLSSAIIGPITGTLAFGALIPAAILTDRYLRVGDVSREVTAGMIWSWATFSMFMVPALTGGIIGLVSAIVAAYDSYYDYEDEDETKPKGAQRVSLLLGVDRLGVSIKL